MKTTRFDLVAVALFALLVGAPGPAAATTATTATTATGTATTGKTKPAATTKAKKATARSAATKARATTSKKTAARTAARKSTRAATTAHPTAASATRAAGATGAAHGGTAVTAADSSTGSAPAAATTGGALTASAPAGTASDEKDYTMPGGQEGTVFKSLTVEGEDRVHYEFERPELAPDLDPARAPGLDPGDAAGVLLRSGPDLATPFTALSAREPCAWVARPWLSHFVSGAVARFRPDVTEVARWKLMIANARGEAVATLEGKGTPPAEIPWDGRAKDGSTVVPDLTYSYVFEAHDRAGNKRNFVGEGFQVSAYRLMGPDGPTLVFSANDLAWPEVEKWTTGTRRAAPPILLEAASWMNQAPKPDRPVRVTVTARGRDQAETIAANVVRLLTPELVGDPARVKSEAVIQPDAPVAGTVAIAYAAR